VEINVSLTRVDKTQTPVDTRANASNTVKDMLAFNEVFEVVLHVGANRFNLRNSAKRLKWVEAEDPTLYQWVHPGDAVLVAYDNFDKNKPKIVGHLGKIQYETPAVIVIIVDWMQSNYSPSQNALGGLVDVLLYTIDPATVTQWDLPTSDDSMIINAEFIAYGLGKYTDSNEVSFYASMFPQKRESDGFIRICSGVWNASDKSLVSLKAHSAYVDPVDFLEQALPNFTQFISAVDNWVFVVLNTTFSGDHIYSSHSSLTDVISSSLSVPSPGVSIKSWLEGSVKNFYMVAPYFEAAPTSSDTIIFLKLNQTTGEWAPYSDRVISTIPNGGATISPDLIKNSPIAPLAWILNEPIVFTSGGILVSADEYSALNWTLRSIIPSSGGNGAFLKSKNIAAVENPTLLVPGSLKTEVALYEHPLIYVDVDNIWQGGLVFSSDSSSDYSKFKKIAPILLPVKLSNNIRLDTVESRMANDSTGATQWPYEVENNGNVIVDEAGTVWSVILEPEQCLYGGSYSLVDSGTTHESYLVFLSTQVTGSPPVTGSFYSPDATVTQNVGSGTITVTSGSSGTYEEYLGPGGALSFAAYMEVSPGPDFDMWNWQWNQNHGLRLKTILRGHRSNGTIVEQDISQIQDAVTFATLGKPTTTDVMVVQEGLEIGDNVWQLISFADKNLVAILRDLHADSAGSNPSPAIEIWEIGATTATKLSTVRLGSYTELLATDTLPDTRVGDQQWNPYAYGPPRMKACRKSGTENTPVILAMVCEEKKVDTATESEFSRVCYAIIELNFPDSPDVVYSAHTSADLGVGNGIGKPEDTDFFGPIWDSWDSLVLTPGGVAWVKDSQLNEVSI